MTELDGLGLPKWPHLLVVGEKVTQDQALEINIRTSSFHFCTNDKAFEAALYDVLNIRQDDKYNWPNFEDVQQAEEKYGVLSLQYLRNHNICSSFIGGPHGWCDWTGNIYADSYNIGKWPGTNTVLNEWKLIAEAFPFLKLRSQLMNKENCEDDKKPIIEYIVEGGKVSWVIPTEPLIRDPRPIDLMGQMLSVFGNPGRERGCTTDYFRKALQVTEQSLVSQVASKRAPELAP